MIIRCPYCEHSRTVADHTVPASAEFATCPKCKHRFRFRTFEPTKAEDPHIPPDYQVIHSDVPQPKPKVADIWDAVDSLHQRWQTRHAEMAPQNARPEPTYVPQDRVAQPHAPTSMREAETPPSSGRPVQPLPGAPTASVHPVTGNAPSARGLQVPAGTTQRLVMPPVGEQLPLDIPPAYQQQVQNYQQQNREEAYTQARHPQSTRGYQPEPQPVVTNPADWETVAPDLYQQQLAPHRRAAQQAASDAAFQGYAEQPAPAAMPRERVYASSETGQSVHPSTAGVRRVKAQADDGIGYPTSPMTPEDRVDSDMRMLQSDDPRPTRFLGKLEDQVMYDDYRPEDAEQVDDGIPWENTHEHGWIRGFISTTHMVMFDAPRFFARLSPQGSLAPGYLFFLVQGYIAVICASIWGMAFDSLTVAGDTATEARFALPVLLLLAPIVLGLALLFLVGFTKIMLQLIAPEKANYPLLFKLMSYSVSPFVLSLIPFVGPFVGAIWFLFALFTGCRVAFGLTWRQIILAPLPPALVILFCLIFLVMY